MDKGELAGKSVHGSKKYFGAHPAVMARMKLLLSCVFLAD
jgi:hypothetical protein